MRKVVFRMNCTADGFCGHTDMIADEELHAYFTGLLRDASALLYGRVTYQLMVPFWPDVARTQSMSEATIEFARAFDAPDKVVFYAILKHVEDNHSRFALARLVDEGRGLKARPGKTSLRVGAHFSHNQIESEVE